MNSRAFEPLHSDSFTALYHNDSPPSSFISSSSSLIERISPISSSIVKRNQSAQFPTKKLCFNYLRGCCQASSEECSMLHPETAAEFEEELVKLSKIDCKYGNKCTVGRCLYKHQNKDLYINSSRAKKISMATTSPQQITHKVGDHPIEKETISSTQTLKEINYNSSNNSNNNNKTKNIFLECFKEMQSDRSNHQNSFEVEGSPIQIMPRYVRDLILNRSHVALQLIGKNENPFKIFSLMNMNCTYGGDTVFDFCFLNHSHFPLLLNHIKNFAEAYQKRAVWVLVQLEQETKLYFEQLLKKLCVSSTCCKVDNKNCIDHAYLVEFQRS